MGHFRFSLSDSGPLRKHPGCAHWAIKAHCALRTTPHFRRFSGVRAGASRAVTAAIRRCLCGTPPNTRRFRAASWAKKFRPTFLSLHVFADRLSVAPLGNIHLGNLLRVPHVGHLRAALASAPGILSASFHARLVYPVCVLRAGHCWGYTGDRPWSPHPPVAELLQCPRNSLLPRNAQARPTERHSARPPVPGRYCYPVDQDFTKRSKSRFRGPILVLAFDLESFEWRAELSIEKQRTLPLNSGFGENSHPRA